jgi:hypothetical protein
LYNSDQNKDYNIDIYCFSAKHTALRSKRKYGLAQNQNNVSWSMSTCWLIFKPRIIKHVMFSFAISYKFTDHAGVFKLNSNTLLEYVHLSVLRQSYLIPGGDNGLFCWLRIRIMCLGACLHADWFFSELTL